MKNGIISLGLAAILLVPNVSWADFQYSETTKFTGGATAGLLKFASKMSGTPSGPTISTHYIKGNRMRVDSGDGRAQIIDMDAHRIVVVDQKKKTYSIITFDQMRARMEQAQEAREQMHSKGQLNFSSKAQVIPTQNTRVILGQNTHEVQAKVDMQPAGAPEASGNAGGAMTYTSDMWVAPGVSGYQEIRNFYQRLAKDAKWAPTGGASADPRMAQAMEEMQKNSSALNGFPMLQSVRLTATAPAGATGNSEPATSSTPTNRNDAMTQAVGGLLGFGKHKKDADSKSGDADSNALMVATIEVTSFSSSAIESSLFDIPAGYSQVQTESHQPASAHSH
jgi:hypothetical protein